MCTMLMSSSLCYIISKNVSEELLGSTVGTILCRHLTIKCTRKVLGIDFAIPDVDFCQTESACLFTG